LKHPELFEQLQQSRSEEDLLRARQKLLGPVPKSVSVVNVADANDASAKQEMSESAVKSSPVWCRRYLNVSFLRRR
jgi:hypothetical protein